MENPGEKELLNQAFITLFPVVYLLIRGKMAEKLYRVSD